MAETTKRGNAFVSLLKDHFGDDLHVVSPAKIFRGCAFTQFEVFGYLGQLKTVSDGHELVVAFPHNVLRANVQEPRIAAELIHSAHHLVKEMEK